MKKLLTVVLVLLAIPVMAQDESKGLPLTYVCQAAEGVRIEEDFCDLLLMSVLRTDLFQIAKPAGRVNDFETQPARIYCRSSIESPPSSGGLIQTAEGTTGGLGLPMTKRSGFAAKACSSTTARLLVMVFASPWWTAAGVR